MRWVAVPGALEAWPRRLKPVCEAVPLLSRAPSRACPFRPDVRLNVFRLRLAEVWGHWELTLGG